MHRLRLAALAAALLASTPGFADSEKFDRSYSFVGDKDIKVGIKVGDVTIDSFRIRPASGLSQSELHVRLARANPHVPHQHFLQFGRLLTSGNLYRSEEHTSEL